MRFPVASLGGAGFCYITEDPSNSLSSRQPGYGIPARQSEGGRRALRRSNGGGPQQRIPMLALVATE
jgi:hypothetical protein